MKKIEKLTIEKLTPEQIAKFPDYVREWTAYGTSTEPADKPRAEAAIRTMYEIAGRNPPQIIWCDSPLSMILTKLCIEKMPKGVWDSVWASVGDSVRASVRDSVRASVGDSVGDSVWDSVWASVRDSVWDSVWASVGDSVYGQHDASWLAFYRFFRDECGLSEQTEKLRGLWELCQSCGWILPFENICFASGRHDICKLDERGLIHSEDGPAIHYADGFSIFAWHGTRVPPAWITDKSSLDPADVLREQNVEVRRAGIEILGWKTIIDRMGGKIIEADPDPEIGTVIELALPDLSRPARFLRVRCATGRDFALGIPPDLPVRSGFTLPHCAQAWAAGLDPAEWRKPSITA